ncbi:MAG: hypothetical protein C4524_11780 [Candidatus Zixiibacteriota bacterium]|nr:MAG: hypothetical protein C4524_11780 [candidate division Zixibacteria bacterium]
MTDSREKMLSALRQAQAAGRRECAEAASGYQPDPHPEQAGSAETLDRFRLMLEKVGGEAVILAGDAEVAAHLGALLQSAATSTVLLPPDPELERLEVARLIREAGAAALNPQGATVDVAAQADMGITTAQAGIADTGTVALWHTAERGRWAALLPPCHVILLRRDRVYPDKLSWLEAMRREGVDLGAVPLTWVTGPSLTADIEKVLVRGAHGPRRVVALVY